MIKLLILAQVAVAGMLANGPAPPPVYADQVAMFNRVKAQETLILKTFLYPFPKSVQKAHWDEITCYKFRFDKDDHCKRLMDEMDEAIKLATP